MKYKKDTAGAILELLYDTSQKLEKFYAWFKQAETTWPVLLPVTFYLLALMLYYEPTNFSDPVPLILNVLNFGVVFFIVFAIVLRRVAPHLKPEGEAQ